MLKATTHEAKTHLSRFLLQVEQGEEIIIYRGSVPVGRLVAYKRAAKGRRRPRVGKPTSVGSYSDDAFAPLTEVELKDWGM